MCDSWKNVIMIASGRDGLAIQTRLTCTTQYRYVLIGMVCVCVGSVCHL